MSIIKVEADIEKQIVSVTGETLVALDTAVGVVKKTPQHYILPFSQETADTLYDFLKGEAFTAGEKTKRVLRLLKDGAFLADDFRFGVSLPELKKDIVNPKSRTLRSAWDLLHRLPIRYIDKSNPQVISELETDKPATIIGGIVNMVWNERAKAYVIEVEDKERTRISVWFFQQHWLWKTYKQGDTVVLTGIYSLHISRTGRVTRKLTNAKIFPLYSYESSHKIEPVYSERNTEKKKQEILKQVDSVLSKIGWIEDPVPEILLKEFDLISRDDAYRQIHFPNSLKEAKRARERIAFDDFIRLQVHLLNEKDKAKTGKPAYKFSDTSLQKAYIESLPYKLTGAQQRVIEEINADMSQTAPMRRLLHGEVGSGKTNVAVATALNVIQGKKRVAVLSPTSVLAKQLYDVFSNDIHNDKLIRQTGKISVILLHSGLTAKQRKEALETLKQNPQSILIGTHSILSDDIELPELGLVVVDEQHKFGTEQREALVGKESHEKQPHLLMMSATPIPRTMSQTIYGDLDLSVINEMPAERLPNITDWVTDEGEAWEAIREQVKEGRQAYVIAALVDESESDALENVENATATAEFLQHTIFPELKVGLVHGRMKPSEKENVLAEYYSGDTNVLVSTSVVEVGVSVPNASVIVILNANRFGIASLHQMRGRVGRGKHQGYCYLVGEATTPEAEERLNALVVSNDGFWLAEKDLEIRREGSMFKNSQHGDNDLFVANLREYKHVLELARRVAPQAQKSEKMQKEVKLLMGGKRISV